MIESARVQLSATLGSPEIIGKAAFVACTHTVDKP